MYTRMTPGPTLFDFATLASTASQDQRVGGVLPTDAVKSGSLVVNLSRLNFGGGGDKIYVRVCAALKLADGTLVIDKKADRSTDIATLTLQAGDLPGLYRVAFSSSVLPGPLATVFVTGAMGSRAGSPVLDATVELGLELLPV